MTTNTWSRNIKSLLFQKWNPSNNVVYLAEAEMNKSFQENTFKNKPFPMRKLLIHLLHSWSDTV